MADDKENYPYLIPMIWQANAHTSPNISQRISLYDVKGIPHAQWGGTTKIVGAYQDAAYKNSYNTMVNREVLIDLDIEFRIAGEDLNISVKTDPLGAINNLDSPKIIFIITYNRDIEQPGNYFASVVRYAEQTFDVRVRNYSQKLPMDTTWSLEKANLVVLIQNSGSNPYIHNATIHNLTNTLSSEDNTYMPLDAKLGKNYPNPFNPTTTITFDVHKPSKVRLEIFNIKGQSVKVLVNSHFDTGRHYTIWDGIDESGNPVSSGVYLYRMETPSHTETNRMILLK